MFLSGSRYPGFFPSQCTEVHPDADRNMQRPDVIHLRGLSVYPMIYYSLLRRCSSVAERLIRNQPTLFAPIQSARKKR
jgi:hypothetical protein